MSEANDTARGAIAVFDAAVTALARGDNATFLSHCDPVSLRIMRRSISQQVRGPLTPVPTIESLMASMPDWPREVAEYHHARLVRDRDTRDRLDELLADVPDLATLDAMSDAAVVAAWIAGRAPSHQVKRAMRSGAVTRAQADAVMAEPQPEWPYVALGAIMDGERIAHVLYRHADRATPERSDEITAWLQAMPADEAELQSELMWRNGAQVQSCRRQPDGSWRLAASEFMLHLGEVFVISAESTDTRIEDGQADGGSAAE